MKIIDLDNITTWAKLYDDFLRNDVTWRSIKNVMTSDNEAEKNSIFEELEYGIEHVKSPEITSLRHRLTEYLKCSFTHAAAYHACRPIDIDSYLRAGISPADTSKLETLAKSLFDSDSDVEAAIKDMGTEYLNHGSEKIGLFISRTGSIESGYRHYLKYGSEFLQCVARRLGDWAVEQLSSQGSPTLFKCAIPLEWLDNHTTFPMLSSYAKQPIIQLLKHLRGSKSIDNTIRGAFLLTKEIPPELILEHIDMSSSIKQDI
jgi:hypothetical protein